MKGQKIKIQLVKLNLTQRWLLEKLQHRGFGTLYEPRFSDILRGKYTAGNASEVLEAAEKVLSDYEKEAPKK